MAKLYSVPQRVRDGGQQPIRSMSDYTDVSNQWVEHPNDFWLAETKKSLSWEDEPSVGLEGDYHTVCHEPFSWFADGRLNVTESCLDRHVRSQPDKTAIIWEGDEPGDGRTLTYRELHAEVCRAAAALRRLGVCSGDRVIIYMGMVPEAAVAMLACARIGAVHSVVFGGFSSEALRDRIDDCGAKLVITQDQGLRGGRPIPLKATVDDALAKTDLVQSVLVYRRTGIEVGWVDNRDVWWHEAVVDGTDMVSGPEYVHSEHPLFILYTSGSTGRPKGLVHTCAGYLTYTAYTHRTVFDLRPDDVYACVADVGWITGHSYIVYGPLANGATSLMFESTPLYPDAGRYWDLVERHKVSIFYTAPTAIRALAAHGEEPVDKYDISSLRVLGTVGEPINPDAWEWYYSVVGKNRCNIVDTWWQTETGGICIAPVASATPTKAGSATLPLPGIRPVLIDPATQKTRAGPAQGHLCLEHSWPGQARTVWGDHARFVQTYFSTYPGLYFTGDGCRRDDDGYYWITGRIDDVLNVSGHRMGTAEFEAALVSNDAVAEAAVVGYPHAIKGQGVYAFVVLNSNNGNVPIDQLNQTVRTAIGAHARVDRFQSVPGLPKTRSGKVMRRILRKVAEGQTDALGDISTLADQSVVAAIIQGAATQR
ncbi:MAG: acetate--CoA ligase [Myxococcales bacterium]|nr:acetate--CoA ligase [Myxococcales bacterium]